MTKFSKGFIRLPRTIMDWEWYDDVNTSKIMVHLLLKANFEKKSWRGVDIHPGQLITSYEKLSLQTGLSISKVRTAIDKLKSSNDVIIESTNKFTKIKVNQFFFDNKQNSKEITHQSQANSKQIATTNNEKEIEIIKKEFKEKVYALSNYKKHILDSFYAYWTEKNSQKGTLRFQNEKFWEIEKRIKKWASNEKSQTKDRMLDLNR